MLQKTCVRWSMFMYLHRSVIDRNCWFKMYNLLPFRISCAEMLHLIYYFIKKLRIPFSLDIWITSSCYPVFCFLVFLSPSLGRFANECCMLKLDVQLGQFPSFGSYQASLMSVPGDHSVDPLVGMLIRKILKKGWISAR